MFQYLPRLSDSKITSADATSLKQTSSFPSLCATQHPWWCSEDKNVSATRTLQVFMPTPLELHSLFSLLAITSTGKKRTSHTLESCSCNVNLVLLWGLQVLEEKRASLGGKNRGRIQPTSPLISHVIHRQVLYSARWAISPIKGIYTLKKKWTIKFDPYLLTNIYLF